MCHLLIPHPLTPCEAVTRLEVEVGREGDGLALRYRLTGDLDRLAIPARTAPARIDGLWEHTCFEAFVAGDGDGYCEFNFAPSTAWAAYRFDGYRRGMAPLEGIAAPGIEAATTPGVLEVGVRLTLPPGPARLGLTAVIEEAGGRLSYWALRHPAERPDFHDAGGFALEIQAP
jgi:hypothetical protein